MEPVKNQITKTTTDNRIKQIDKALAYYKAQKLLLKARQAQQTNECIVYEELKKRMEKAYQKNKRNKKISKLQKISTHWKGLENYEYHTSKTIIGENSGLSHNQKNEIQEY